MNKQQLKKMKSFIKELSQLKSDYGQELVLSSSYEQFLADELLFNSQHNYKLLPEEKLKVFSSFCDYILSYVDIYRMEERINYLEKKIFKMIRKKVNKND